MNTDSFNTRAHIQFAEGAEAFRAVIAKSSKNDYIHDRYNHAGIERPLKYLMLDEPVFFRTDTPELFFYVQNNDGELIAATKLKPAPNEDGVLWFMGTNVHPDHRNKGLAKELILSAMNYASEKEYAIGVSRFSEMGLDFLRPLYPKLHTQFPHLEIRYGGGAFTNAERPYCIAEDGRTIISQQNGIPPTEELTFG